MPLRAADKTRGASPASRLLCLFATIAFATIAFATTARHAQAGEPPSPSAADAADPRAVQLSREGLELYRQHDYAAAVARFRASYDLSHAPLLLFDLGQAYRLLGDCVHAAAAYRDYLAVAPDAPQRQKIAEWIAGMSSCLQAAESTADAATTPDKRDAGSDSAPGPDLGSAASASVEPAASPPSRALDLRNPDETQQAVPIYRTWWFWTAAALVAGAALVIAIEAPRGVQRPQCSSDRLCQ